MRNLKRALSLALAAAMLISLMVVGASAAEYKDQVSVSKDEAVAVLTGLGVVGGDQNGNFNPTATLTRAEYCVMIANALTGGTFDRTLFDGTDTPFTDVQGHWGAAYIAYCYSTGVIAGTSATTFSPDSTLTAAQAAAILLMALGYNQNNEFAANGQFSLNVTKWAQQAGLYTNLSVAANSGISRENAAQVIFNALTVATPVGYNTLSEAYYTLGTGALDGKVIKIDDNSDAADWEKTLAHTNFDLKKDETGTKNSDDFNRPGYTWVYNGEDVYFATKTPVASYTTKMEDSDVTKALKDYTMPKGGIVVQEDGVDGTKRTAVAGIAKETGNGVLVEVYANAEKAITDIVVINEYLGKVTKVAENDDGNTEVSVAGMTYETSNFEKGDRVIYTKAGSEIQSMVPAESVQGTVTATATKYIKLDGTSYNFNDAYTRDVNNGDDCVLYLDTYGNIIATGDVESEDASYAYVSAIDENLGEFEAKLVLTDGSTVRVDVDEKDGNDKTIIITGEAGENQVKIEKGSFVTYEVDGDVYTLTLVDDPTELSKDTIKKGTAKIKEGVVGSNATIYIDVTDGKTYTGYKNVPSMETVSGTAIIEDGLATYVFITAGEKSGDDDSTYIFVADTSDYETVKVNKIDYKVFNVYVDGEATEMYIKDSIEIENRGLYKVETVNDDGYVTEMNAVKAMAGMKGGNATVASNGVLTMKDGTPYTYDDNTLFIVVDLNSKGNVDSVYVGDVTDITLFDKADGADNSGASGVYVAAVDSDNDELATVVYVFN